MKGGIAGQTVLTAVGESARFPGIARTGPIANQHLRRTGSQSDRLRALPSSACNQGNALLSGRRRAREETEFAPVRRRSHGRALRRFAEDHEVRGARVPHPVHCSGLRTRRQHCAESVLHIDHLVARTKRLKTYEAKTNAITRIGSNLSQVLPPPFSCE